MKNEVTNNLAELASSVGKVPFLKKMLKPIYYPYKNWLKQRRNKQFQLHALEVLKKFDECMEQGGFGYTLAFGTLLGAIREKGFIKNDLDIDIWIWESEKTSEITKSMINDGFKLEHSFEIEDGKLGREDTFAYNNISLDIFYIYPPVNKYPYCCDFLAANEAPTFASSMKKYGYVNTRRFELPFSKERTRILFEGISLYAPTNSTELLKLRYGKDYMIPNPKWTTAKNSEFVVPWKGKKAIYKEY